MMVIQVSSGYTGVTVYVKVKGIEKRAEPPEKCAGVKRAPNVLGISPVFK